MPYVFLGIFVETPKSLWNYQDQVNNIFFAHEKLNNCWVFWYCMSYQGKSNIAKNFTNFRLHPHKVYKFETGLPIDLIIVESFPQSTRLLLGGIIFIT